MSKKYLLLFILLFLIELYIGFYVHDAIIRPYIGDLLVVVLIYCFIRIFLKGSYVKIASYTFIFACLVEFLQYFKVVSLLGLGDNKIARIIIGNSFSWIDILAYFGGFLVILVGEKYLMPNKRGIYNQF